MSSLIPFEEFLELWEEQPLVIPDTNAILDLYRNSSQTSEHVLEILGEISDQLWIPHQVSDEYYKNYRGVIAKAKKKYDDVTEKVGITVQKANNDIEKQFIRYKGFKFPKINELGGFINAKIMEITEETSKFRADIKDEIDRNEQMLQDDHVKTFMDQLSMDGKVGGPFTYSQKISLYVEGDSRYLRKIPPGYMDEKEKDKNDETKTQKFGDLFVWKQLLAHAEATQQPIVFITNDDKEDWWTLDDDKNPVSPREELITEFHDISDKNFTMISLPEFVNHLSKIINKENTLSFLELNSIDVVNEIIEQKGGWDVLLDRNGQLTSYLIHSGDLQDYVDGPLSDVEVLDFLTSELEINSVELDDTSVSMEGRFTISIEANISEAAYSDYEYSNKATISIEGSINIQFEIDLDLKEDNIKNDTIDISSGGFEVQEVDFQTIDEDFDDDYPEWDGSSSDDTEFCPGCGKVKDRGQFNGGLCTECEADSD